MIDDSLEQPRLRRDHAHRGVHAPDELQHLLPLHQPRSERVGRGRRRSRQQPTRFAPRALFIGFNALAFSFGYLLSYYQAINQVLLQGD